MVDGVARVLHSQRAPEGRVGTSAAGTCDSTCSVPGERAQPESIGHEPRRPTQHIYGQDPTLLFAGWRLLATPHQRASRAKWAVSGPDLDVLDRIGNTYRAWPPTCSPITSGASKVPRPRYQPSLGSPHAHNRVARPRLEDVDAARRLHAGEVSSHRPCLCMRNDHCG